MCFLCSSLVFISKYNNNEEVSEISLDKSWDSESTVDSTDHDLKCFELKNIKHSEEIKEMISESVEEERSRNRVSSREFMSGSGEGDDMEDLDDDI